MANNNRTIVYGNQDKSSAMYAAMFGMFGNTGERDKGEKKQARESKPAKAQENSAPAALKTTPATYRPSANVNSGFKKPYSQGNQPLGGYQSKKKQLSPEEFDTYMRTKTITATCNILKDFGDLATTDLFGRILDYSEIPNYLGEWIVLKIVQNLEGAPTELIIQEEGDRLWEYIESQPSPRAARRMVQRFVDLENAKRDDFKISFDGKGITVKGDKKLIIYMKWAILDILSKVYDSEEYEEYEF